MLQPLWAATAKRYADIAYSLLSSSLDPLQPGSPCRAEQHLAVRFFRVNALRPRYNILAGIWRITGRFPPTVYADFYMLAHAALA